MSGFILRIIAMVTMLTDHIACNLLDAGTLSTIMRSIGRIAFPIYAFLLAEGFLIYYKNKDKVKKHISSLIVLIVASELFYDLMECGLDFANYMIKGNFNLVGPWLVIAYYWFIRLSRNKSNEYKWSWIKRFAILLLIFVIYLPIYFWVRTDFGSFASWIQKIKDYIPWIIGHLGAALILSLYNGKLGYHNGWFRRIYISFYPIHACIVGIIRVILGQ